MSAAHSQLLNLVESIEALAEDASKEMPEVFGTTAKMSHLLIETTVLAAEISCLLDDYPGINENDLTCRIFDAGLIIRNSAPSDIELNAAYQASATMLYQAGRMLTLNAQLEDVDTPPYT